MSSNYQDYFKQPFSLNAFFPVQVTTNDGTPAFDFPIAKISSNVEEISVEQKKIILKALNEKKKFKLKGITDIYREGITLYFDTSKNKRQELLTIRGFGKLSSDKGKLDIDQVRNTQEVFAQEILNSLVA